jgi:hypothetical protein
MAAVMVSASFAYPVNLPRNVLRFSWSMCFPTAQTASNVANKSSVHWTIKQYVMRNSNTNQTRKEEKQ